VARSVKVTLGADISDFKAKLRDAGLATRQFSTELNTAAKAGKLDELTRKAGTLGLGLAALAVGTVKMAADFDKSMSAAAAATNASTSEVVKLRAAAIDAGQATQFSATQAADGITELGKAGVSTTNILGGGLKGALNLAAAGQISVADAASISASALTQFKLSGSAVPHVADLLAAGANKAQGGVSDLGQALNQSGLVASQFGLSVNDTVGALSEFASAGLIGSDAGTSFKTMLQATVPTSKQTQDLMTKLGISFYDAQGKFVGLAGVAQVLQDKLKGLTQEQRNQALAQIFGSDAVRTASVLYTDGAKGVRKWTDAVNVNGYAAQSAAKLTDNLSGDIERLKGSLETVAIQSGGGATAGLRSLAQGVTGAVNAFSGLPHWVQESVTVLSGVGGASLLAVAGFLKAKSTLGDLMEELKDAGPRGAAAASALGKVSSVAGKLGIAGVAAVGLYEGMKMFGDWVDHFSAPVSRDIDKMSLALESFAATGVASGELGKTFGANLAGISADFAKMQASQAQLAKIQSLSSGPAGQVGADRAMAAVGSSIKQQAAQAQTDVNALDQALAQLATNGSANQAKIAFQEIAAASGKSIAQFPQYAAAAQQASVANSGLAQGFGSATANTKTMTSSLNDAVEAGQKLTDVWTQLNGAVLSTDQANLSAKQAIDAVKASFKENGKAVDDNSEKALKNRIAVGSAAKAAADAAQAKYAETGSVSKASSTYDGYISALKRTLKQAGLTKGQIATLVGAYAQMPKSVTTNVKANGASAAASQVRSLKSELSSMKTNWSVTVKTHFETFGKPYSTANPQYGGLAKGGAMIPMAAGGIYPASNPPLIKFAEPETGGELYMPRKGISRSRAQGLLAQGASWYGLGVSAMAQGGVIAAATGLVNVASGSSSSTLTGTKLDTAQAYLQAAGAVASLTKSLKDNGKSFSTSTEKGRENRSAVYDGISAAQGAAKAKFEETGSVTAANKAYDTYIAKLKAALKQQHVNSATIKSLLSVAQKPTYDTTTSPKNSANAIATMTGQSSLEAQLESTKEAFAWTKPTFNVKTDAGRSELQTLFSYLSAADTYAQAVYDQTGNSKTATTAYNSYISQLEAILIKAGNSKSSVEALIKKYGTITLTKNRLGGLYQHAAAGALTDSQIAPAGPTQYAWAEPETGGELFAPKNGDLAKTRSNVGWAVSNWWGGQVNWTPNRSAGASSSHTVQVAATIPITLGSETITRQVQFEVDTALGQVTAATVYQTA
jgi:TP901 family phage tail tape measure protein